MGKSSPKPKQDVTEYYMSVHYGICAGPVDKILRIDVGEKPAWEGVVSTETAIAINRPDLFGGPKKEGGVRGIAYYLPGGSAQVFPDGLASRWGKTGATSPGFRGLTSLFFVGSMAGGATGYVPTRSGFLGALLGQVIGISGSSGFAGFMWGANSPYLRGAWATVLRSSIGLNPIYALVPRPAAAVPISTQIVNVNAITNAAANDAGGLTNGVTISGFSPLDTLVLTLPAGQTYTANFQTMLAGTWDTRFRVIPDGDSSRRVEFSNGTHGTAEAARSAFPGAAVTGGSSYTFYIWDSVTFDNAGGLSIKVDRFRYTGEDSNPAHMIYEALTNSDWGMGAPSSIIDVDAFEDAAATLFTENFGLSMIWTRQSTIEAFITEILDHIQAMLFVNPRTGLLTLKLLRDDFDRNTLRVLTPDNATMSNFQRKSWGETVNEIVVTWTNPANEQEETTTLQDLGNLAIQGGIVSDNRNYYGVRSRDLAARLAARDLRSASQPLAIASMEVDRSGWDLLPGDVVKVTWPDHGLDELVMRINKVDYGKTNGSRVKIDLIEDIFSLSAMAYVVPPESELEEGGDFPEPVEHVEIITLPAFITSVLGGGDAVYPEVFAGLLASHSGGNTLSYELISQEVASNGALEWRAVGERALLGRTTLATLLPQAETSVVDSGDFGALAGNGGPTVGGFILFGTGGDAAMEIALIDSYDSGTGAFTLARGCLDTVPREWPVGTPVWFVDAESNYEDITTRSAGQTVSYKLLAQTSAGLLAFDAAPTESKTLGDRPHRPNRPANVSVGGVKFNTIDTPVDMTARPNPWVTATWANRNRTMEDSQVVRWTEANVTPESGQTTTITVYPAIGSTPLATHSGLTGTSFDIPDASFGSADVVRLRFSASRTDGDGTFASLQAHEIYVRVGHPTFDETGAKFDSTASTWDED